MVKPTREIELFQDMVTIVTFYCLSDCAPPENSAKCWVRMVKANVRTLSASALERAFVCGGTRVKVLSKT
jgi:hypothetical protein